MEGVVRRKPPEEGESYFMSMTDMMVGLLLIFIILLAYFALNLQTKTEELTKVGKVKLEIHQLERDLDKCFASLGRYVYGTTEGENVSNFTGNDKFFKMVEEAKDFKETDSGLEYIGERNQQMGDGGIIAQITDTSSGVIAAAANAAWFSIVVHRAPLIKDCEKDSNPYDNCQFEITEIPTNWASAEFNDNAWTEATKWTENDVGPKDGYNQIPWGTSARLIWGSDLEVDNTVLLRMVVEG